jgi:hypothetical protein
MGSSVKNGVSSTEKCQTRIFTILMRGNMRQDWPLSGAGDLRRHFNRKPGADPQAAIADYSAYIDGELQTFSSNLQQPTKRMCYNSLMALGRVTHSWEDFYAHAVLEPQDGGPPTFNAWSAGVSGTPDSPGLLLPSTYPGEHPAIGEPVDQDSPEGKQRIDAAKDFLSSKLSELLPQWLDACRCPCESTDWFYIGSGGT